MLFAKKLINPTRWELVWGNNITESSALDWLTKDTDEETGQYFREPTRQREVVSFFSQAAVVEGTDLDLTDTASEKRRVGLSANEIRRRALRQIELMDQRSRPIPKKSELIANLLRLNPPSKYAELSVENHSIQGIQNMLRHRDTAPYYLPENGRLITLDHESTRAGFDILNPSQLGTLTLEQLEDKYPSSLSRLVNFAIGKILRPLGVGFSNGRAYFLAYREAKEGKPRRLELETGETLQVAKPYLSQANSEDLQVEGPRKLNFVFHQAFSLRYRKLWDQHFVEFRLGKAYTQDGAIPLEGRSTARLDTRFRNPAWDRSETRQRKMEKLAGFLFHSKRRTVPRWIEAFNFGNFLRIPTEWTPDAVPLDQAVMDDFEVTDEGGDE